MDRRFRRVGARRASLEDHRLANATASAIGAGGVAAVGLRPRRQPCQMHCLQSQPTRLRLQFRCIGRSDLPNHLMVVAQRRTSFVRVDEGEHRFNL
jgi:hypothetical protein